MSNFATPSRHPARIIELGDVDRRAPPDLTATFNEAARRYCAEQLTLHSTSAAGPRFEACSDQSGQFLPSLRQHPFIAAVHHAFALHRPLVLSPHAIWLLIVQALASHINANSESLRPRVVQHQGKLELVVRRDDFQRGAPDNPWTEVFDAFATQIRSHLNDGIYDLVVPEYSVTTANDVAVTQIALMDSVQSYFSYLLRTLCGIPQIHLEGTASDWRKMLQDAHALARFDLQWWTAELVPVLEQFVSAADGTVDADFWNSLYKYRSESGGPYINGWINVFFPYLNSSDPSDEDELGGSNRPARPATNSIEMRRRNFDEKGYSLKPADRSWIAGGASEIAARHRGFFTSSAEFPAGLSVAPFKWDHLGTPLDMRFVGGFMGVLQDPDTLALRPELGWCVVEASSSGA